MSYKARDAKCEPRSAMRRAIGHGHNKELVTLDGSGAYLTFLMTVLVTLDGSVAVSGFWCLRFGVLGFGFGV